MPYQVINLVPVPNGIDCCVKYVVELPVGLFQLRLGTLNFGNILGNYQNLAVGVSRGFLMDLK